MLTETSLRQSTSAGREWAAEDHWREVVGMSRVFLPGVLPSVWLAAQFWPWPDGRSGWRNSSERLGVVPLAKPSRGDLPVAARDPARPIASVAYWILSTFAEASTNGSIRRCYLVARPMGRRCFQIRMLICEPRGIGSDDEAGVRLQRLVRERKINPRSSAILRETVFAMVP